MGTKQQARDCGQRRLEGLGRGEGWWQRSDMHPTRRGLSLLSSLTALALLDDVDHLARLEADLSGLLLLVAGHHHVLLQEHGVRGVQTWAGGEKTRRQPAAGHGSASAAAGRPLCHGRLRL